MTDKDRIEELEMFIANSYHFTMLLALQTCLHSQKHEELIGVVYGLELLGGEMKRIINLQDAEPEKA